MRYFHPNFGAGNSSLLAHDHPLGEGGNGVFPTTSVKTNTGVESVVQWMPQDNGGWTGQTNLVAPPPGNAAALNLTVFAAGDKRVELSPGSVKVFDADNTVMFEVP